MPVEEDQAAGRPRRRRRRAATVELKTAAADQAEVEAASDVGQEPAAAAADSPQTASPARPRRARNPTMAPIVLPPPPEETEPEGPPAPVGAVEPQPVYALFWRSGILNVLAIARREIASLLVSPVGWVLAGILVLFTSLLGFDSAVYFRAASMSAVFSTVVILMLLFVPIYTMRLVAQERDSGTLEIILTSPVRDWELVGGKWLGGFGFFLLSIAFTLVYVVLLFIFQPDRVTVSPFGLSFQVASLDYGQILADYVGLILAGAMFVGVGVLMSSLTRSQIIAAVLSLALLLLLWNAGAPAAFMRPPASTVVEYLAGATHFNEFDRGAIALKDVVYFLTFTAAALFLATRVIEARKWA
jgi:ABC-2 type transport system permease protein